MQSIGILNRHYFTKCGFSVLALSLLSACGGGSSSSDTPAGIEFRGTQQLTIRGGGINETESTNFLLVLSGNTIFITDSGNPAATASGTLSGDSFTATGDRTVTEDGLTCTFNLTYTGSIIDNAARGNITGNVPCSGLGSSVNFSASGSFTGTR